MPLDPIRSQHLLSVGQPKKLEDFHGKRRKLKKYKDFVAILTSLGLSEACLRAAKVTNVKRKGETKTYLVRWSGPSPRDTWETMNRNIPGLERAVAEFQEKERKTEVAKLSGFQVDKVLEERKGSEKPFFVHLKGGTKKRQQWVSPNVGIPGLEEALRRFKEENGSALKVSRVIREKENGGEKPFLVTYEGQNCLQRHWVAALEPGIRGLEEALSKYRSVQRIREKAHQGVLDRRTSAAGEKAALDLSQRLVWATELVFASSELEPKLTLTENLERRHVVLTGPSLSLPLPLLLNTLTEGFEVEGHFMVLAPAKSLQSWQDEFEEWAPRMRVVRYEGAACNLKQIPWPNRGAKPPPGAKCHSKVLFDIDQIMVLS